MVKFIFTLVFAVVLVLAVPKDASAQGDDGNTLRHAYRPYMVENTKSMRARVDNFANMPQTSLVCVEATNNASGVKTHIGCLKVMLDSFNSKGMWAMEFNAPLDNLSMGTYTVWYTYQASDGSWHNIKSVAMQSSNGSYTAR